MCDKIEIEGIGNYYGGLNVKEDGLFYWGIENHNGINWERIPESLYDAIVQYNKEYWEYWAEDE